MIETIENMQITELTLNQVETQFTKWVEGHELVCHQRGNPINGLVLYGFDELGEFDEHFENPVYSFLKFA
jgi:hypothetical protein